jgi:hypothetical protein
MYGTARRNGIPTLFAVLKRLEGIVLDTSPPRPSRPAPLGFLQ